MPYRILCLHGMGVNAAIFASQTAPFRSLLPNDYDFHFIDGPFESESAPGIESFYPNQRYLCWYDTPTTAKVAAAHRHVLSIIDRDGPFEAVMGFSQGAALAASMIIHHQLAHGTETPPLFRAAVFMCSPIPFSHSLEFGIDTRNYFGTPASKPNPARPACPTKVPEYLITDPRYLRGEEALAADKQRKTPPKEDIGQGGVVTGAAEQACAPSLSSSSVLNTYYQMFHHTTDSVRIEIPTAHIYGRKDKWRLHSMDLVKLCDSTQVSVLEHLSGHEVPRDASEDICDIVETVFARGLA
ncbi:MAG: hypothetical protein M1817_000737 [Caeruleum heppii]|nr:MAG: hypothetical protein M1817_000737 [Caeruleum heppii]